MIRFLLACMLATAAPAAWAGAHYGDDVDRIQRELAGAKEADAKKAVAAAFERFDALARKDAADFAARSYAGLFAAQRCQFTSDIAERSRYMDEAIPLLDKAVRMAKKTGDDAALAETLFNRAEIYTVLPAVFHKEKIALEDATKLDAMSFGGDARKKGRAKLLLVRALVKTGALAQAKSLLAATLAAPDFPQDALARDVAFATDLVKKAD